MPRPGRRVRQPGDVRRNGERQGQTGQRYRNPSRPRGSSASASEFGAWEWLGRVVEDGVGMACSIEVGCAFGAIRQGRSPLAFHWQCRPSEKQRLVHRQRSAGRSVQGRRTSPETRFACCRRQRGGSLPAQCRRLRRGNRGRPLDRTASGVPAFGAQTRTILGPAGQGHRRVGATDRHGWPGPCSASAIGVHGVSPSPG